ncbi:hypothetical protein MMC19_001210 [Ptychographa xylographoides]|nr:hypothetical protein [Ptychographa xylographoides]
MAPATSFISAPRPQYFIHRADGTLTPLIALDELPESVRLANVPTALSIEETVGMTSLGLKARGAGTYEVEVRDHPGSEASIYGARSVAIQEGVDGLSIADPLDRETAGKSVGEIDETNPLEGWRRSVAIDASATEVSHTFDKYTTSTNTSIKPDRDATPQPRQRRGSGATEQSINAAYNPATPGQFAKKIWCSHWIRTGECDFTQQGCIYKHVMPDIETLRKLGHRHWPRWYREAEKLTPNNAADYGREPGTDPTPKREPVPVPQPVPQVPTAQHHPQALSTLSIRNTHTAPMYGRSGPRSAWGTGSITQGSQWGGNRWPSGGFNNAARYPAGPPHRTPPHHNVWRDFAVNNGTAPQSPSPFVGQQQGLGQERQSHDYRTNPYARPPMPIPQHQDSTTAAQLTPNLGTAPIVGTSRTPQPMNLASLDAKFRSYSEHITLEERFAKLTPNQTGSTVRAASHPTTQFSGPRSFTDTNAPLTGDPSFQPTSIMSRPSTAHSVMKDFVPLAPAQPVDNKAAPPVTSSGPHKRTAPVTRPLTDGLPVLPAPQHPRRFEKARFVAPDQNIVQSTPPAEAPAVQAEQAPAKTEPTSTPVHDSADTRHSNSSAATETGATVAARSGTAINPARRTQGAARGRGSHGSRSWTRHSQQRANDWKQNKRPASRRRAESEDLVDLRSQT